MSKGQERETRNRVFVSSSPRSSVCVLPFIVKVKEVDVVFDALRRHGIKKHQFELLEEEEKY